MWRKISIIVMNLRIEISSQIKQKNFCTISQLIKKVIQISTKYMPFKSFQHKIKIEHSYMLDFSFHYRTNNFVLSLN